MNKKVICDNCKGQKYFRKFSILEEYEPCPKCLGSGELDWLEKLFGKKSEERTLYSVHLNGKIFWVEPNHATGELRRRVAELLDVWKSIPTMRASNFLDRKLNFVRKLKNE
jgi:hypothetical protein